MQLTWRDSFDRTDPNTWRGIRLRVAECQHPGLSLSASFPGRIRLSVGQAPLLWARVDDDYWGYGLLRAPRESDLSILPPISADIVREHDEAHAHPRGWATTFARLLQDSPHTPLYDGEWHLGRLGGGPRAFELGAAVVRQVVDQKPNGYVQWDFGDPIYPITLRDMSPSDAGRVKAWRKHVRGGSLPPVLLQWISGLAAYVVLDGHDRLLASAIESASAPALALEPVRDFSASDEQKEHVVEAVEKSLKAAQRARSTDERLARVRRLFTTEDANRVLLDAFSPWERPVHARARPIPGGPDQWASEVREALAFRAINETSLLDT
jgi:hypothetical protein